MPTENDHPGFDKQGNRSKMVVIDAALEALGFQLGELDNAGLSMASIHLNVAIERLRRDKAALQNQLEL